LRSPPPPEALAAGEGRFLGLRSRAKRVKARWSSKLPGRGAAAAAAAAAKTPLCWRAVTTRPLGSRAPGGDTREMKGR